MLLSVLMGSTVFPDLHAETMDLRLTRGPFLQSMSTEGVAVLFHTNLESEFRLELGSDDGSARFYESDSPSMRHLVEIQGLEPGENFSYQIEVRSGGESIFAGPFGFKTFTQSGPVGFTVIGDSGVGGGNQHKLAETLRRHRGDLMLHTGDIIYGGFSAWVDSRFFHVYGDILQSTPIFPAIGNHDLDLGADLQGLAFQETFHLPINDVTGTEHFYSFDHGDVHFVCLFNPWFYHYVFKQGNEQYNWLIEDLARSDKPWKILYFHMPLANSGGHAFGDYDNSLLLDTEELKQALLPVVRAFGVKIVLTGHDHNWQRYAPVEGMHQIVTGGGGAGIYSRTTWNPGLVKFLGRHHFLKVGIQRDTAHLQAIDIQDGVIDEMWIRAGIPEDRVHLSRWHTTPTFGETQPGLDGNHHGQVFDFPGPGVIGRSGDFSNLGSFHVHNDNRLLYLGFQQVMLHPGQDLYLFIDPGSGVGVHGLKGIGNGLIDPGGQGADGLDFLENLAFKGFRPELGLILGNEWGDGTDPGFEGAGRRMALGQGCFRLNAGLDPVPEVLIQQFNESPQFNSDFEESNADYIAIQIPLSLLGGMVEGKEIRLAAVVGGDGIDPVRQTRNLDSSLLGTGWTIEKGLVEIEPIRVRLSTFLEDDVDADGLPDLWETKMGVRIDELDGENGALGDLDGDGMSNYQEWMAGTDPTDPNSVFRMRFFPGEGNRGLCVWNAVRGRKYQLEWKSDLGDAFQPVQDPGWPTVADGNSMAREVRLADPDGAKVDHTFYRMKLLP